MVITYHGGACIKVSAGDTTLVFSPVSKQSKAFKPTNFGTDIAFVSHNHADMNGIDEVARGGKEPFVIAGPGEYEIASVYVTGFETRSNYGGKDTINTVYEVRFDNITMLYCGALDETKLPASVLEDIESVDVLLVPIAGTGVLGATDAQKLAVLLEAKVVIPILWSETGAKGPLAQFLKEAGAEDVQPTEKLTIKQKDVALMTGETVILKP